ncbi:MAG TPA: hypothetical protein VF547_00840, partial [Allosphingosinicella sp.]
AVTALVLAVVLQLDSIGLINRLSVDEELRNSLVEQAVKNQEAWRLKMLALEQQQQQQQLEQQQQQQQPLLPQKSVAEPQSSGAGDTADEGDFGLNLVRAKAVEGNATAGEGNASTAEDNASTAEGNAATAEGKVAAARDDAVETNTVANKKRKPEEEPLVAVRRTIEQVGVVALPRDWKQWSEAWWEPAEHEGGFRWALLFGILLSAALLSLGAPFWYSVLANLLKLRSALARKDEVQREERQTTQAAATATTTGAPAVAGGLPPNLAGGEAGDLGATG